LGKVLTSWKEIARYLGKGVRTVQRWEAVFDLPVRRAARANRRAVIAMTDDLDAWIRSWKASHEAELVYLRREVADLRARNEALTCQLNQCERFDGGNRSFDFGSDVLARSSQLILESAALRKQTVQLVSRTRDLRKQINESWVVEVRGLGGRAIDPLPTVAPKLT
jgi:hypothetical protein